jgi:hypothetical protein
VLNWQTVQAAACKVNIFQRLAVLYINECSRIVPVKYVRAQLQIDKKELDMCSELVQRSFH